MLSPGWRGLPVSGLCKGRFPAEWPEEIYTRFRVKGLFGDVMVPNITPIVENQMEKNMEDEMEAGITGVILYYSSSSFIWGYYGTQYRVRFYPPFGV